MKKFFLSIAVIVTSFFLLIIVCSYFNELERKREYEALVRELENKKKTEQKVQQQQQNTQKKIKVKKYVEIDPVGSAPLRSSPGGTTTITRIPVGYRVEIIDSTYERGGMMGPIKWYKVKYKNYTGWISQYVTTGKVYRKPK